MEVELPKVPSGTGKHPIALVVVSANNLAASGTFYSKLFGWQIHPMSAELMGVVAPGGPTAALRSGIPAGFPGMVPYIAVPDVDAALSRVVAAGGTIEKATWNVPMVGKLPHFQTRPGPSTDWPAAAVANGRNGAPPCQSGRTPSRRRARSAISKCTRPTAPPRPASSATCSAGARSRPCRSTWPSTPAPGWAASSSRTRRLPRPGVPLRDGRRREACRNRAGRRQAHGRADANARIRLLRLLHGPVRTAWG